MKSGADYTLPVDIPGLQYFLYDDPFSLESGYSFENGITIAYHTYGELNAQRDNVIWVCHALTANSRVDDWWSGIFGENKILDPTKSFIVCANVLGSCYGTTGARSVDPKTGEPYGMNWPLITVRDWVKAHDLLRAHLGINKISLCIGGSCGGHQVLEYGLLIPDCIEHLGLLVTSARESAWAIAGHEAQRLALQADPTLFENTNQAGSAGMKAARGMALLGYRTIEAYIDTQTDSDDVLTDHLASTYIRHQGEKLEKRFYAHCFYYMIGTLDTHHLGRNRGYLPDVLNQLTMKATVIGIDSDRLIPVEQQIYLAEHLPNASLHVLHSPFGHDGFLIETEKINSVFLS
jgi:homoserine O-acetyltransferase/O-succinyltransferase